MHLHARQRASTQLGMPSGQLGNQMGAFQSLFFWPALNPAEVINDKPSDETVVDLTSCDSVAYEMRACTSGVNKYTKNGTGVDTYM